MTNEASIAGAFEVAILAGGKGTRLKDRSGGLPKPLVPVLGKSVLQHQIERCRDSGFTRILLLVHHQHELITQELGDGSTFGLSLGYHVEAEARGTAGALRDALPQLAGRFLVLYGDTYFDVDLRRLWNAHGRAEADATLFLHPNDHPQDSDLVELDGKGRVRAIRPYPHPPGAHYRNLVNAALYVLEREGLAQFADAAAPSDIAKHLFPAMLAAGRHLHGYVSPEYIKDMGTPGRLDRVENDIRSGLVERLSGREPRAAVFIDRDGTLVREIGHLNRPEQIELLPGAAAAVRRLNRAGRLAIVATNQPVVARGEVSLEGLEAIHACMESGLGAEGAYLDGLYVCPHHPDRGFPGEVPALKIECDCRKPGTGLIDAACRDMGIDRGVSWMVGDTTADIETGRRSGLRTVLVRTGHAGSDDRRTLHADYEAIDLLSAVGWILQGRDAVARQLAPLLAAALSSRLVLLGGLARSGKSSVAQVLRELLHAAGARAHVVALDAWLQPPDRRPEGSGVLARYNSARAAEELVAVLDSAERQTLQASVYDRASRNVLRHRRQLSIGRDDIVLVEGVPALLIEALRRRADLALWVYAPEAERLARLRADYRGRGWPEPDIDAMLASRGNDESPQVNASATLAQHSIASGNAA